MELPPTATTCGSSPLRAHADEPVHSRSRSVGPELDKDQVPGTTSIALIWALSATVVNVIARFPPVTVTGKDRSSAVFGAEFGCARMSKLLRTCFPLIDTLNTRLPAVVQ